MYILTGKGSVAGASLAQYIVEKCQEKGVLWDDDLPEYTLDFVSRLPSVSKSIREKTTEILVSEINKKISSINDGAQSYMLLCFTAHQLIPYIHTKLDCINLVDLANQHIEKLDGKIAFLGTLESLPINNSRFVVLENHVELIGDLITSVKRGYKKLGENYAGHPRNILEKIVAEFKILGVDKFFLACTDLHDCNEYLRNLGIDSQDIIDIIEIAGDVVISRKGRDYNTKFLDQVSDNKTYFRYKYLTASDAPSLDIKTEYFYQFLHHLPIISDDTIEILDIGGSSTGHSIKIAEKYLPKNSNITLQDISQRSLETAQYIYKKYNFVNTYFSCSDIVNFEIKKQFNIVLCLGVLVYISSEEKFEQVISKIASILKPGGCLITRDGLITNIEKQYMAFGGVLRNEDYYYQVLKKYGFKLYMENSFVIERPIYRKITSMMWVKEMSNI